MKNTQPLKSTTVIAVEHNGEIAIGADGQATLGHTVVKDNVQKIRSLQDGAIIVGFAGATADAFTLLERLEGHIKAKAGNMFRGIIDMAKEWRTDRSLRPLECMMIVMNNEEIFVLTGSGDVMRPDQGIAAVGSGSSFAQSAATALKKHAPSLTAQQIVEESLHIAADICIYTNHNLIVKSIKKKAS